MKPYLLLIACLCQVQSYLLAQHDHPQQDKPRHDHSQHDTLKMEHADSLHVQIHEHDMDVMMSSAFSKNLPMNRNGSGTSWLPDNSPVNAYMFHSRHWMYMVHGNAFLRYNKQDLFDAGSRGGSQFDAPNMVMFMGQRNVGQHGLFHFSTMYSLDALTVGEDGYPLLFQTGETYQGEPLVDRQHPHDLFSELSISYAHAFNPKTDLILYFGYPGEPALGPSAFVHRPSAYANPDAPLTHHWVDATHITFGVATVGLRVNKVKLEGSIFTGREPDEDRYDFDKALFDSWSTRLSFNPDARWATQVSHGFLNEPEALEPGDVRRTTASVTYSFMPQELNSLNMTALWGMNRTPDEQASHGILLEGAYDIRDMVIYGRYEWVQKSREDLDLPETEFDENTFYAVNALTGGLSYDITGDSKTKVAIGGQLSINLPDDRLTSFYGDMPMSGQVYVRVYPGEIIKHH